MYKTATHSDQRTQSVLYIFLLSDIKPIVPSSHGKTNVPLPPEKINQLLPTYSSKPHCRREVMCVIKCAFVTNPPQASQISDVLFIPRNKEWTNGLLFLSCLLHIPVHLIRIELPELSSVCKI